MLALKNTENMTGALINGDYWDLDELCTAIYQLTGKEDRYLDWQGARLRLLGVSYDLRHAYQGERHIDTVANGLHKEVMKAHDFVASENNIYYSTEILWPELVFTFIALNDFIDLYKKYEHKTDYDVHIVTARKFQAIIAEGLKTNMPEADYQTILTTKTNVEEYAIQYIDMLNLTYIEMTKEQRIQSFPSIAKNIVLENKEYVAVKRKVMSEANQSKSAIHQLKFNLEYPKDIEW